MDIRIGRKRDDDTAVKEHVTAPDRIHPFGASRPHRPLTKMQAKVLRHWADISEWCRAAINHRRRQVSQSQWGIVPVDPKANFDPQLQAVIELLFLHPNTRQKTFRELIEPMVEDILVLDRGVCEKESNVRGLPIAIHLVDGGTIRTKPIWDGKPNTPRYEWWPNNVFVANLLDTQIVLMMENPSSHRVDGFSPMEALKATIDADLAARDFNTRMVAQTSPVGMLNLGENAGTNVVDAFRVYWDAEVAGNKQMAIVGGVKNPQFIGMGQTARDMQYMQWQVYLLRKIAAVFGIAPQDLGVTFDINRANACYSEDTETLTQRGWLSVDEVASDDLIATVNPDTGELQYRPYLHKHVYDYDGEMVHFSAQGRIDAMVTPNHRMWWRPYPHILNTRGQRQPRKDDSWRIAEAQEIEGREKFAFAAQVQWDVPEQEWFDVPDVAYETNGRKHEPLGRVRMDDWLEFVGYAVSEGGFYSKAPQEGSYIFTFAQKDKANAKKMSDCFRRLGLQGSEYPEGDLTRWSFSNKQVWTWAAQNISTEGAAKKRLPRSLMMLGQRQLSILFEALMLGDGSWDTRDGRGAGYYASISKGLADDVQEVALRLGYRATVRPGQKTIIGNRQPLWHVKISRREEIVLSGTENVSRIPYKGRVYCFEVPPNGLFVTRRDGIIGIHGNSVQQELSEDRGFKPLLRLIEEQFNTKIIADFTQTKAKQLHAAGNIDMQTLRLAIALTHVNPRDHADVFVKLHSANILNLAFKFRMRSAKSTRDQADYNTKALAGIPWETVNQVRANDGLEPQEGGDKIIVMTPIGAMPLDMIGGQMVPQTEDQKRYLEGLFQVAPLVLGRGTQSLVPMAGGPPSEDKEVVVVTNEIEVDEYGDPVED